MLTIMEVYRGLIGSDTAGHDLSLSNPEDNISVSPLAVPNGYNDVSTGRKTYFSFFYDSKTF